SSAKTKSTDGLDKGYAMSYSTGITEPFVMMIPRMYGGSTSYPTLLGGDGYKEMDEDNSKALEALKALPQELGQQIAGSSLLYWGGIQDGGGSPSTSGPPYVGAIICFLAILSFFVVDKKHKWWALAAIIFTIMMSWGSNFSSLNDFLFNNLPLYNKYRAPSMALVIPQLLLPMLAILGANSYINATDKKALWPSFKKGLIATGIVFVILLLFYISFSYLTKSDNDMLKQARNAAQPQLYEAVKSFFDGLKEDRKGLFMGDILRSFGFIAVAAITLFLLIKKQVKPILATLILATFVLIDLLTIDSKYLNKDNYQDKATNENVFSRTAIDNAILADTSFYRVFNLSGGAYSENVTSYNYNSIGGYHPAKIRIYQDIIEKRIAVEQNALIQTLQSKPDSLTGVNTPTLNMLNAKYFIYKERDETKAQWKNANALGNCWFVNNIQFVKDADGEMAALNTIDPKTTAVIQESFKGLVPDALQPDSTASIRLVKNDNDLITYNAESATNQFAVFSEVYYASGWKAFIDGKETPIVKTNYVLRGLAVPAGKHTIEFKFAPKAYFKGKKLTAIASYLLIALLALGAFMQWKDYKKKSAAVIKK
ncbi:MAG: YfhO family protein, partial [Chitinophagaceae bacterium]